MLERTLSLLIALLTTTVCNAAPRCDEMPTDLATMRTIDQSLRERLAESDRVNPRIAEVLAIVDGQNTKSLSHLLSLCGWPSISRHGWQASDDAWLLVQHADRDRPFQQRALRLLAQAVKSGNARGGHLAYLSDRLAVAEGKPQPYGTQFKVEGCAIELMPIDSRHAVNERRRAIMGMPTLDQYEQAVRENFSPEGCHRTK